MTPAGIELATFRFLAQHLNHCARAVGNIKVKINLQHVTHALITYLPTYRSKSPYDLNQNTNYQVDTIGLK